MKPRVSLTPEQNVPGTRTTVRCPVEYAVNHPNGGTATTAVAPHYLVVRQNRETGHTFLSCDHWPDCDGTAEIVLIDPNQTALFVAYDSPLNL